MQVNDLTRSNATEQQNHQWGWSELLDQLEKKIHEGNQLDCRSPGFLDSNFRKVCFAFIRNPELSFFYRLHKWYKEQRKTLYKGEAKAS